MVKSIAEDKRKDAGAKPSEKMKFHIRGYRMMLPDSGKQAELVLATTESAAANIQATLSFVIQSDNAGNDAH